jgi:hypothetical protein
MEQVWWVGNDEIEANGFIIEINAKAPLSAKNELRPTRRTLFKKVTLLRVTVQMKRRLI